MGVVYRAIDRRLGRSVALKFLAAAHRLEGESRERFVREARAASALDHPHVGTIHGIEETPDGEFCIVMAYYEGETLAARLARGPLPLREALQIGVEAAAGLAEAHAHGIIHRDIKPSNILLTRVGVKLVDFGLAKFMCSEREVTHTSGILGTAAYMSPEQARGEEAEVRSDIWSLGAVLYEMVSGKPAFRGGSTYALLHSVVNDRPERPGSDLGQVDRLILRALQKEPADRFASMEEFGSELRAAAAALEAGLSRPSIQVDNLVWKLKPRTWVLACVLTLAVSGSLLLPSVRARIAEAVGVRPSAPPTAVAILPFTNTSDPEMYALGSGLAETLSARIGKLERYAKSLIVLPAQEVISRNVSDAEEAKKLLGATLAISGVLSRGSANVLMLDLEVRDERRPDVVRLSIEDAAGDMAALEDRAAAQVCSVLDIRANANVIAASHRRGASGGGGYESYLRGLGYLQRWDRSGNLDKAIAAFGQAIRGDAEFAPAYVGMAEASRTRFRVDKDPANVQHALNYAQQAVRLGNDIADAHVVMGRVYQDTAQRDLAVLEFQRSLELDPHNMSATAGMGRAYEDLGRLADAENAYKRAVTLQPYAWIPHNTLASFYLRHGRFGDAEVQYRRALVLTPDNVHLINNLGIVVMRQLRFQEAAELFRKSIDLGPTYPAYLNLGNIHYRESRFRLAAEAYDRALQINNKDFRVWGTKAQALRLAGAPAEESRQAYQRAIELGEEALRVNPGQARTLSLLAIYHVCVGDRAAALQRLNDALTKPGLEKDVLVDAAAAYELLQRRGDAIRWAQSALAQGYSREDFRGDPDLQALIRSGAIKGLD